MHANPGCNSDALPAATIRVDPSLAYVGGTVFDLNGVANAEIHCLPKPTATG